ncbi:MAG: ATP-binding protein [Colwellia sp.]|nr:ATP-binding protein [Colwellia sp.]MCW9080619.1 ATP-binding protein [Colwellia sp.]
MLTLISVNLSSSFNDFVTAAENKHLTETKQQLISLYQQNNNWQPIINNVQVWRDIVDPQTKRPPDFRRDNKNQPPKPRDDQPRPRPEQPRDNKHRPKPASPSDFLQTGKRLSLYDSNKKVIVGKRYLTDNPHTEAIEANGIIIGWLGFKPSNLVKDSPASEFLNQQYKSYYLIAIATVLIAFIMAFIFSKHLLAPIKKLIKGTNRLIEGDYQNRISKTTHDELGSLSDNVNVLAETLEKNQKNRFQWMSDTSHELRTPLTVLRAQLIAIQDGVFSADEKRVQLFIDEIDNLSHLVNDLYQLSSSDAGGLTYQKTTLNPITLLTQVIENFSAKFKRHELTVTYSSLEKLLKDKHCYLPIDKERLKQLFANLLENCCRYTQSPGKIIISAHYDEHFLDIMIEDSAPGVAKELQQKLFERFYRVEQSRNRSYGGSGLGLSLCKQIVEAHQGTITALDSSLGGLCIKITFPIQKVFT